MCRTWGSNSGPLACQATSLPIELPSPVFFSFLPYVNNKGADQPVHPHSLISTFVVHCLDSIIPCFYIRNFKTLPCFCGCTDWFASTLVANPEDRFSHDEAQIIPECENLIHIFYFMKSKTSFHNSILSINLLITISIVTQSIEHKLP